MLGSEVIFQSAIDPDDTSQGSLKAWLCLSINTRSRQRQPGNFGNIIKQKHIVKRFKADMLSSALPTTLLQIFCEVILNFYVIISQKY